MAIVIKNIERDLINKRVRIETESTITIFKNVTGVIDALTALENPEIRLGVNKKKDLLYVAEGFIESITPKYKPEKDEDGKEKETSESMIEKTLKSLKNGGNAKIYVYSDMKVDPLDGKKELVSDSLIQQQCGVWI